MTGNKQKRTVCAPQPAIISSSLLPANRVISVELTEDEDIEWMWISLPDGTSYVNGYTIIKNP